MWIEQTEKLNPRLLRASCVRLSTEHYRKIASDRRGFFFGKTEYGAHPDADWRSLNKRIGRLPSHGRQGRAAGRRIIDRIRLSLLRSRATGETRSRPWAAQCLSGRTLLDRAVNRRRLGSNPVGLGPKQPRKHFPCFGSRQHSHPSSRLGLPTSLDLPASTFGVGRTRAAIEGQLV